MNSCTVPVFCSIFYHSQERVEFTKGDEKFYREHRYFPIASFLYCGSVPYGVVTVRKFFFSSLLVVFRSFFIFTALSSLLACFLVMPKRAAGPTEGESGARPRQRRKNNGPPPSTTIVPLILPLDISALD